MDTAKQSHVRIAWILISLFVMGIAALQAIPQPNKEAAGEDPAGLVVMQLQSQWLIGAASLSGDHAEVIAQASALDMGSIGQRQRYMALMIFLKNLEGAKQSSLRLQADLDQVGKELTEDQAITQKMLDILTEGGVLPADHASLSSQIGWFGELLEADEAGRATLESLAEIKVLIIGLIGLVLFIVGVLGFFGLLYIIIRVFDGSIKSSMAPPMPHHGIYAEMFALWLLLFVFLMSIAGILGKIVSEDNLIVAMSFSLLAFFLSLIVLGWARLRGISFQQLKLDIGWHTGAGIIKEVAYGIVGYAMTLPLLALGVVFMLLLILIQQIFVGGVTDDPFIGTGGGAHPIIVAIESGGWQVRVLIITLAAVAAPIIEETIFRGVLYRQLRTSSKLFNQIVSVLGSVVIVSFLFAAIHPQGWVAIPPLMGIAIGMNLMREWRGTIIPSMVIHGLSNGIVTSMLLISLTN